MNHTDTMKLAIEALAVKFSEGWHEGIKIDASDIMLLNDAAQALAEQPAQQEPDAFVPREAIRTLSGGANHVPATLTLNDDGGKAVAVFLSPQPAQVAKPRKRTWVGLTDEEAQKTFMEHNCTISADLAGILARAIEAKLKEKNT